MVVLNEGRDLAEEKGQRKGRKTRFAAGLSGRGRGALLVANRD